MKTRKGIYYLTFELLEQLLSLDNKHKITGIQDLSDLNINNNRKFQIKIEGPKMPEVLEGEVIPIMSNLPVKGLK